MWKVISQAIHLLWWYALPAAAVIASVALNAHVKNPNYAIDPRTTRVESGDRHAIATELIALKKRKDWDSLQGSGGSR